MFRNWFRRRRRVPVRRVDVVCYPKGQSLIDDSGFYVEDCGQCGGGIVVSPSTAYAIGDANQYRLVCVHCAASNDPDVLLSQDYINEAYGCVRHRRDLAPRDGEPVKTLGSFSMLLQRAFPREFQD